MNTIELRTLTFLHKSGTKPTSPIRIPHTSFRMKGILALSNIRLASSVHKTQNVRHKDIMATKADVGRPTQGGEVGDIHDSPEGVTDKLPLHVRCWIQGVYISGNERNMNIPVKHYVVPVKTTVLHVKLTMAIGEQTIWLSAYLNS